MHFQCIVVEFDAHLLGGELPIHTDLSDITPLGPSGDLAAKCFQIRDAPVEALLGKDAQFDLGDVQPTAMYWVCSGSPSGRVNATLPRVEKLLYSEAGVWVFKLSHTRTTRSALG